MERALIDWDFAAEGIWLINSSSDAAPAPSEGHRGQWSGAPPLGVHRHVQPWSDLLTTPLLARLQRWNDRGCSLARLPFDQKNLQSFYRDARELADMTQLELGDGWRVLWAAEGAWHFVRFP